MGKYISTDWTDEMLLDLIQRKNDHAAFSELYNRNWKFLYNAVYSTSRDHECTLDICQNLFLWIWENRKMLTIRTNFRSYLFVAAKYKVANMIRKGKINETHLDSVELEHIPHEAFDPLELKELKNLIDQLINKLPPKCREVFLMSRNNDLSHKQIASKLGLSEKTVDEQITRALKKLRPSLQKLVRIVLFI